MQLFSVPLQYAASLSGYKCQPIISYLSTGSLRSYYYPVSPYMQSKDSVSASLQALRNRICILAHSSSQKYIFRSLIIKNLKILKTVNYLALCHRICKFFDVVLMHRLSPLLLQLYALTDLNYTDESSYFLHSINCLL